jgi:hypothetical protein
VSLVFENEKVEIIKKNHSGFGRAKGYFLKMKNWKV